LHNDTKTDLRLDRIKMHNGELVNVCKFPIINTKRISNKTKCDQVLSFGKKYIFAGTRF